MTESYLEKSLRTYAKRNGVAYIKLVGMRGIPDRMLLFNGKTVFFELKNPTTGRTKKQQKLRMHKLHDLGFETHVINDITYGKVIIGRLAGIM